MIGSKLDRSGSASSDSSETRRGGVRGAIREIGTSNGSTGGCAVPEKKIQKSARVPRVQTLSLHGIIHGG